MKKCDAAPWCLWQVQDDQAACWVHTELPVKVMRNQTGQIVSMESAEAWQSRWNRTQRAKQRAEETQRKRDEAVLRRR